MNKKYILNGKIYTEDDLLPFAKENNLDLGSYIIEVGAKEHLDNSIYQFNGKEYDGNTLADFARENDLPYEDYLKEIGAKKKEPSVPTSKGSQVGVSDGTISTIEPKKKSAIITFGELETIPAPEVQMEKATIAPPPQELSMKDGVVTDMSIVKEFEDFPKGAEQLEIKRESGEIEKPYSRENLLKLRDTDYGAYKSKLNGIKTYFDIRESLGTGKANEFARLQFEQTGDLYNDVSNYKFAKSKQKEIIDESLTGEQKQKALDRLNEDEKNWVDRSFTPQKAKEYINDKFKKEYKEEDVEDLTIDEVKQKLGSGVVNEAILNKYKRFVTPENLEEGVVNDNSEKGSRLGFIWNSFLNTMGSISSGASDIMMQLLTNILPEEAIGGEGTIDEKKEQALAKWRGEAETTMRTAMSELYGTEVGENKQKQYEKEFITSTLNAAISTVPMMISPYGAGLVLGGYDIGLQTINNTKEGKKLPESTKTIFAFGVGTADALIEKIGLDKIFGKQSKKVAINLAIKTISELIEKTKVPITKEVFESALEQGVKSLKQKVINAGGKISKGASIEFLTGASQETVNILAERITNLSQDKQIFEPQSMGKAVGRVLSSAGQEAAVGGLLGGVSIFTSKTRNYIAEKVAEAKSEEDIAKLKDEVLVQAQKNNIGAEESNQLVQLIDNYSKINSKIPSDVENRREVIEKINERNELKKQIDQKKTELENADDAFKPNIQKELDAMQGRYDEMNEEVISASTTKEAAPELPRIKEGDRVYRIDYTDPQTGGKAYKLFENQEEGSKFMNSVPGEAEGYYEKYDGKGIISTSEGAIKVGKPEEISKPIELSLEPVKVGEEVPQVPKVEETPIEALKDVESTTKALEVLSDSQMLEVPYISGVDRGNRQDVAEAYHKAKADDSNPELVKTVEGLLGKPKVEEVKVGEEVTPKAEAELPPTPEKATPIVEEEITPMEVEEEQPPFVEGGREVVTRSGLTEQGRQKLITQRNKELKITDRVKDEQAILDIIERYNSLKKGRLGQQAPIGLDLLNKIRNKVGEFNQKYNADYEFGRATLLNDKNRTVKRKTLKDRDAEIDESRKTLRDRDLKTQEVFDDLFEAGAIPTGYTGDKMRMSESQLNATIQDILDGVPSRRANNYLDALEKQIREDDFDFSKSDDMPAYMRPQIKLDDVLGVSREDATQPMTEEMLNDWLSKESEVTPENQEVYDNIENLITYHETRNEPEGEVRPTPTPTKERVTEPTKPVTKEEKPSGKVTVEKPTAEKVEPKAELPKEEKAIEKTALQKATEARKAAKARLDSLRKGLGISPEGELEALVDYHRALVKEAKEYIKEGVKTVEDLAKQIGEKVDVALKKAWDEATGKISPIEKWEDLGYGIEDISEKRIGLSKAEIAKQVEEFGMMQPSRRAKITDAELDQMADDAINAGYNVQGLIDRLRIDSTKPLEERQPANDLEVTILNQYAAALNAEQTINPSKETLKKYAEALDAARKAFSITGATLRQAQRSQMVVDNLSNFLVDKENAQGAPLTENQLKEETAKFEELKAAKDAFDESLKADKEKDEKLIAEIGFNKAKALRKKEAKKTNEEYNSERKSILNAAKEALGNIPKGGELYSTIPGLPQTLKKLQQLKTISPFVKEYMGSLLNQGVDKLDNIVTDIHAEFKDVVEGITKADILKIIGGVYDTPVSTRNELAVKRRLLEREAKLLNELTSARKGEEAAKTEKERIEKSRRIQELERQIKETRELNREDAEPIEKTNAERLATREKQLLRKIEKLNQDLKSGNFLQEKKPLPPLEISPKTRAFMNKVIELEEKIRAERFKDEYDKKPKWVKNLDKIGQVLGVRRLMQTAFDLSVSFRQGATLFSPRNIKIWAKSFKNEINSITPERFKKLMYEIRHSESYHEMVEDGVVFNDLGTVNEDYLNANFMQNIPGIGQGLRASQRAADGFLNTARYELYQKFRKNLERQGLTRQSDPKAYKEMASWVMAMTGRGNMIKALENPNAQQILGNTFYGARLMASRFQLLNLPSYLLPSAGVGTKFKSKEMARESLKDMASWAGTVMAVGAALAATPGASISLNPDDSDFLQVRYGDKVYDISGGTAAYIRTFLRITQALIARTTRPKYIGKKKVEKASESTLKFFRNKLAPNTSYATDAIFGGSSGREFDPYAILKWYPMYGDDLIEGLEDEGVVSLATIFLPNMIGLGLNTYAAKGMIEDDVDVLIKNAQTADDQNPESIKNYNKGGVPITDEEFNKYIDVANKLIGEDVTKFYKNGKNIVNEDGVIVKKSYLQLSPDEIANEIESIKLKATKQAKEELFGAKGLEQKVEEKMERTRKRIEKIANQ